MIGNDLTKGNVTKTLMRFTLPFLLANVLHTLYGIVDLYIVGQYADATQISAVSIGTGVMMLFNCLLMGLSTGGTVAVGQMSGSRREKDLNETVSTIFTIIPLISVGMLVIGIALRVPFLRLLNCPEEAFSSADAYLSICLIGLIFTGLYNAIAAVLRGMGDSKGPTIFVSASCLCNIVGDIICVGGLQMGAAGAALATTVSQGISVLIGYIYLRRHNFPFDFRPRSFRMYKDKLRMLMHLSIPTAFQEGMTSVSFLALEAIINAMGYIAAAAAGVVDRVFNVSIVPAIAFSGAISAMVAQNTGAGEYRRARKCLRIGMALCSAVAALILVVMVLFPNQVVGCFTKETEVISQGVEYLTYYRYDCLFCAIAFCLNGYINGTGHTRWTMVVNIVSSLCVRLPVMWALSRMAGATLRQIGLGFPSASLVQMALGLLFLFCSKYERSHREPKLS